ncbi:MAG: DUF4169 family protein [Hyphomicrobiales bacterium]|nr:DUF4169 family protein [Hyphomicrobiales bacterium]
MAEIINLRRARKQARRAEAAAIAAQNRALHGRSGAERDAAAATEALETRRWQAHVMTRRNPEDER